MFFKGRSKAFWIYFVEVVVFSIDMNDRNFISIQLLEFCISIDIDNLNLKCEFLAHALQGFHSIFTKVTAVARVNGNHDCILAP